MDSIQRDVDGFTAMDSEKGAMDSRAVDSQERGRWILIGRWILKRGTMDSQDDGSPQEGTMDAQRDDEFTAMDSSRGYDGFTGDRFKRKGTMDS